MSSTISLSSNSNNIWICARYHLQNCHGPDMPMLDFFLAHVLCRTSHKYCFWYDIFYHLLSAFLLALSRPLSQNASLLLLALVFFFFALSCSTSPLHFPCVFGVPCKRGRRPTKNNDTALPLIASWWLLVFGFPWGHYLYFFIFACKHHSIVLFSFIALTTHWNSTTKMAWFGDFGALCSSCVPLPSCNLLLNMTTFPASSTCVLTMTSKRQWPVRDLGKETIEHGPSTTTNTCLGGCSSLSLCLSLSLLLPPQYSIFLFVCAWFGDPEESTAYRSLILTWSHNPFLFLYFRMFSYRHCHHQCARPRLCHDTAARQVTADVHGCR